MMTRILFSNPRRTFVFPALLILIVALLAGCASKPPREQRMAAEQAYISAKAAEKCAPITYKSALQALERARDLTGQEKYDEARLHFETATKLFEQARREAEANVECMRRLAEEAQGKNKTDSGEDDGAPTVVSADARTDFKSPDYELVMIHFPFNSDEVTEDARETLQRHARWMINFPDVEVLIEGHCDERGSLEYNLSLGQRRAEAVKTYLIHLGAKEDGLRLLSYGEERPLIDEQTEEAWNMNRRVQFKKLGGPKSAE